MVSFVLKKLAEVGLNIFASTPVELLPSDLLHFISELGITLWPGQSICVVGNGGGELWKHLPHPLNSEDHPVDRFALEQVRKLNREVLHDPGLEILFPNSKFVLPLQRLGRALNISQPSLLGLDINPEFGVWFAYRAVFLTEAPIARRLYEKFASPCLSCEAKPCRSACTPKAVGISAENFSISACAGYRFTDNSPCADRCLARIACSYKPEQTYSLEQIQYHMKRPAHLEKLRGFVESE